MLFLLFIDINSSISFLCLSLSNFLASSPKEEKNKISKSKFKKKIKNTQKEEKDDDDDDDESKC